ncbi:triphosphoribosyl-dephospho-CoA synthase [Burkholderia sp. L27(2015)]|uniref:triphosphoribosyl-dephospho-CoA synthase n=1 Tax=Burkholderia sp. L27(2015) TaxID=1641858 RepID=UPI00131DC141|nr:triphosphoribosyl-dephospho-CoA synthase [Burkholderia sp. L27(2015)]
MTLIAVHAASDESSTLTAALLADYAVDALLAEARLTPKPALVDRRGSGAHRDLDLTRMTRSAHALRPTFAALAMAGLGERASQALRERLALIGRRGEVAMLSATGGSNAHRGAIWVLGLLAAAAAMQAGDGGAAMSNTAVNAGVNDIATHDIVTGEIAPNDIEDHETAQQICASAAQIAAFPDRFAPPVESHGLRVARRFSVGGAREQARAGFPHVREIGLPALRAARVAGHPENIAQLDTLMAIMTTLADTCLLHRGGLAALHAAQRGARRVLDLGGVGSTAGFAALLALDTQLLALNASPGGAADLLAATLFIDRIASRGGDRRTDHNAYCNPSRNPHQEAQPQWNI